MKDTISIAFKPTEDNTDGFSLMPWIVTYYFPDGTKSQRCATRKDALRLVVEWGNEQIVNLLDQLVTVKNNITWAEGELKLWQ